MLDFSRPFKSARWALAGALMLVSTVAVAEPSFVKLNGIRVFFDGTQEQVEVLYDSGDQFDVFGLVNAAGMLVNVFTIQGSGENQVYTDPRDTAFVHLSFYEDVQLRSLSNPLIVSNSLRPTGEIVLHSATIVGANVELVYSKGFRECAWLIDENGTPLSIHSSSICGPANMAKLTLDRASEFLPFSAGDEVRLQTILRPDLTTNSVVVGMAEPDLSCVVSEGTLSLKDRAAVTSTAVYAEGNISMSWDAKMTGKVQGANDAHLFDRAKITGDLQLIGDLSGNGIVTGSTQESFPVPFQSLASRNVADGGPNHTVNHDGTLTLAPGAYGNVVVRDRGRLTLSASGTYRFKSLKFQNDSKLRMNTNLGEFKVEVQDQLQVDDRFKVQNASGGTPDGSKIFFYTNDDAVALGYDSEIRGELTAPNADLVFKDRATVRGCVRAEKISLGYDSGILEN